MLALSGGHLSKREKLERHRFARKAGRPKKAGDRYPSGDIVYQQRERETREQVMANALNAPHRRPFGNKQSALAGYAAGRLFLRGEISRIQYRALERYAKLSRRHMHLEVGRTIKWPGMVFERVDNGDADAEQPAPLSDEEAAEKRARTRQEWEESQRAIFEAPVTFTDATGVLMRVGCLDYDLVRDDEIGTLQVALNALARLWEMGEDS